MLLIILTIICACAFAYFLWVAITASRNKETPEIVGVLSSGMTLITGLLMFTCIVLTILEFCKN